MRRVVLRGGLPGGPIALAVLATMLASVSGPAPVSEAFAHAFLERASPPVGSEITTSPPELSILFTEGVEPLFSQIEVGGADGAAIATGKPHLAPDSNRRLIIELPKLPPGTYTVIWHATSVDTHKTEGNFKFTVTH
jgi:methionine-rich copper-binding protein CopC